MPESTPIYGFTYPCDGEIIDPTAFQTLATQIDTRMASVLLDENYATGRYSSSTTAADQAGIAAATETPMVNAGSTYLVPADGVYWVTAQLFIGIAAADFAAQRIRVRLNGTPLFGRTYNAATPNTIGGPTPATGLIVAAAGDTISMAGYFNGTGPGTAFQQRLMVRMLVRIF